MNIKSFCALVGLFACHSVKAEMAPNVEDTSFLNNTPNAPEIHHYFISFSDESTNQQFNSTIEWLNERKCEITENYNEEFKYLVSKANVNDIDALKKRKNSFGIEEIENDEDFSDDSEFLSSMSFSEL